MTAGVRLRVVVQLHGALYRIYIRNNFLAIFPNLDDWDGMDWYGLAMRNNTPGQMVTRSLAKVVVFMVKVIGVVALILPVNDRFRPLRH